MAQTPPQPGAQWGGRGQPSSKGTNPLIFVAAAAVLVVIGVGVYFVLSNGDDDDQRDEYVDAITSGQVAALEGTEDPFDLSETDIRCLAEVMVDVVGVDRLADQHTPEELQNEVREDPDFRLDVGDPTREEAEELTDGLDRCWGFFEKTRDLALSRASGNPEATPEFLNCATEALDDDFLRSVTIGDFMGETDPSTATSERLQAECGDLVPQPGG